MAPILSIKRIYFGFSLISSRIPFTLSSNIPLSVVPAINAVISKETNSRLIRNSGTSSLTILYARLSPIAVLPTPSPPRRIALFFFFLPSIRISSFISRSLPTRGSILPSKARLLIFVQYDSTKLFFLFFLPEMFSNISPISPTLSPICFIIFSTSSDGKSVIFIIFTSPFLLKGFFLTS